jgi:phage baseplate assembly protein W
MPSYIGFSTIGSDQPRSKDLTEGISGGVGRVFAPVIVGKKFRLVDEQLVLQDFLNALNISQGQKVGQPEYGTTLWSFVFEPDTIDVQTKLQEEITRLASLDPRMTLNTVSAYPQENGILIEMEIAVLPFNNPSVVNIFFDNLTSKANIL